MELSRRNFIKFVAGGAAGTALSPLPWKLTDDIAIWTQNWPWVPVPPTGEFTNVNSVCNLCPGGCGISVRKVDTRAIKIDGRTDYPVNPGGICPLGMGGLQLLYNKTIRYPGPMRRIGPRGKGEFVMITWDEALDILAKRISGLRKNGIPEALAAIDGNQRMSTMSVMVERLLTAVGSPNYVTTPSIDDIYLMSNLLLQGTEGPMAYDLENADYVLSFGCGLLEGWGAPGRVMNAWGLWHDGAGKAKAKIVQVESRASNTASKADRWVASRPGTDAALALGLAHVIIKNGLYNSRFINNFSFGFENWTSPDGNDHIGFKTMVLDKYSPDQVAKITGLNPEDIVSLAKEFARAKAPIAIYGKGNDDSGGGVYECMAVHTLNALVGNINKPGGVLINDPLPLSQLPEIKQDAISRQGLGKPRIDQAGTLRYPFAGSLINNLADKIIKSPKSPVDTLLIFSANPVYTLPDGGAFKEALKKIPFVISFSPFRDETSYMADLVLPDHTYLEKMDDVVWPTGLQYPFYGLSKPVVEPLYNTRNSGDVIIELSKLIDSTVQSAFPWEGFEGVLKARAKGLFKAGGLVTYDGINPAWDRQKHGHGFKHDYKSFEEMWTKIKAGGLWYQPVHGFDGWEGLFKTPDRKFEFFSKRVQLAVDEYARKTDYKTALKNMGITVTGDQVCMPHYEAVGSDVNMSAYPLRMMPYEMINLASGWIPSPPFLYKTIFDNQLKGDLSFAAVNPKTATEYGLKQGDRVIIKSPAGEVEAGVAVSEGAMPGIVYLPFGFGHTAYDEFLRGKGVNPNKIIDAGKDPLSGHSVWWNTHVNLVRV